MEIETGIYRMYILVEENNVKCSSHMSVLSSFNECACMSIGDCVHASIGFR